MTITIEHVGNKKEKSNGRPYRSFWLRVQTADVSLLVKSCMYYVDTGTMQMPYFGSGISLIQFDTVTYHQIEELVRESFLHIGESEPTVSEKDRKEIQAKIKAKLKKGKKT